MDLPPPTFGLSSGLSHTVGKHYAPHKDPVSSKYGMAAVKALNLVGYNMTDIFKVFACFKRLQQQHLLLFIWATGLRHLLCHFWFNLITWPHLGNSLTGNLKV